MLQPRFFPRTQLQPRLPRNPGAPSRAPTSPAGGTPGATCRTRAGASPQARARGRARGLPRPFRCPAGAGGAARALSPSPPSPSSDHTRPPPACQTRWPARGGPALLAAGPRGAHAGRVGRPGGGAGLPCACAVETGLAGSRPGRSPLPARGCLGDACRRGRERGSRGDFPSWSGRSAGPGWTGSAS